MKSTATYAPCTSGSFSLNFVGAELLTQINGFNTYPSNVDRNNLAIGATVTFSGQLMGQLPDGTGGYGSLGGRPIQLQLSVDNATWTTLASGNTDANGVFAINATFTGVQADTPYYIRAYYPGGN